MGQSHASARVHLDTDLGRKLVAMTRAGGARSFVGSWHAPGLIGAYGRGLALLAGRRTFTRIEAYGDPEPERLLRDLVERWKQHGRPTERDLRVEVTFGREGKSSITWSWDS